MLHITAVEPKTLALLKQLLALDAFEKARLVGGTALALHLGHRKSIDLDFFGEFQMELMETGKLFSMDQKVEQLRNTPNIKIYLIDGIKVDIVNYGYKWLDTSILNNNLRLASIKDIAAMKLSAIAGRGTKKDFIDLSFLLNTFSLKQMMGFYLDKYHDGSEFLVLKSLGYFQDAEESEMPEMIVNKSWKQTKKEISFALQNYQE